MGMFDSFYDKKGDEWQTKAFDCRLDEYEIGDEIDYGPPDYQVGVLGGGRFNGDAFVDSYATIIAHRLASVPAERDTSLALLDYSGGWIAAPEGSK